MSIGKNVVYLHNELLTVKNYLSKYDVLNFQFPWFYFNLTSQSVIYENRSGFKIMNFNFSNLFDSII